MFRQGQHVVCVDDSDWLNAKALPIKKGECYLVHSVSNCPKCGVQLVDVGLKARAKTSTCTCRRITFQDVGDTRWFRASRFAPVIDNFAEEVMSRVEEDIKKELVPMWSADFGYRSSVYHFKRTTQHDPRPKIIGEASPDRLCYHRSLPIALQWEDVNRRAIVCRAIKLKYK